LLPPQFATNESLDKYAWHDARSNTSMLLLGLGALYRAAKDGESPNMRYEWYEKGKYWADLRKDNVSLVSLIATRRIGVNEELVVPMTVDSISGQRTTVSYMLPTGSEMWVSSGLYDIVIDVGINLQQLWMRLKGIFRNK
jgi:hypothetical protein